MIGELLASYSLQELFGHGLASVFINSLLIVIILLVVIGFVYSVAADILEYRRLIDRKTICLELTPPAFTNKIPLATEQLFSVLHGLNATRSRKEWFLRRKIVMSLEVVSTINQGIRYLAKVPDDQLEAFKQSVTAYLPDVRFSKVPDYIESAQAAKYVSLMDFKQTMHFAYPLNSHNELVKHDPIAYLTNAMTKLEDNELMAWQVVLSPTNSRSASRVRNKLMTGKEPGIARHQLWWWPFKLAFFALKVTMGIFSSLLETIGEAAGRSQRNSSSINSSHNSAPTAAAQAVLDTINSKLAQPLFNVSLRALVATDNKQHERERLQGLVSSLTTYRVPGYQGLTHRSNFPARWMSPYRFWQYERRLPYLTSHASCILSSSELAGLYHFPHSGSARTDNVVKSLSKTLPAPVSLKDGRVFDVIMGDNHHHDLVTPIGLTKAERERHVYIIGGTGNGKTTMLEYAIVQDIKAGKGVAIIDPHGDLAQKLLQYIPEDKIVDVIYLNPRDLDYPIGLNLLELPTGLSGSDLAHEKDLTTEAIISVLRKIFEDNSGTTAYRIERILRNAIHTAFTVEGATLFTVLRLLTDKAFRKQVVKALDDPSLKRFWNEELGQAGEYQRVKISGGPIARIERFERSESARRILDQAKSTIDFGDIVNSGKILICNFSKGRLGEDTSTLFGTTVLAKLQLAAWRRDDIPEAKRRPFYLYVDEFQNFASTSFMGLFSEARKYKLFMTIAQQSVSQLDDQGMVNTIMDNVGTIIAFRSKSPATESLLLHQFGPYVEPGEIGNLPSFNFYARIAAIDPQEPLSGRTLLLNDYIVNPELASKVIESSRTRYARLYQEPAKSKSDDLSKPKTKVEKVLKMKKPIRAK